jgi:hypothetical protein
LHWLCFFFLGCALFTLLFSFFFTLVVFFLCWCYCLLMLVLLLLSHRCCYLSWIVLLFLLCVVLLLLSHWCYHSCGVMLLRYLLANLVATLFILVLLLFPLLV